MVTRREAVRLDLEDHFPGGLARATAQTALFKRELNSLSGTSVQTSRATRAMGDDIETTGTKARKAGADIDRFSGRVRLLAEAALILGPALVPLGAGAITAVAGLAAQFGALAGGIGVSIAALNGVGDALEAVNEYQLDPTGDNLEKVAEEFKKLGPAGAEFVIFLESITPQLREMQMLAREGFLPGLADGIEAFLDRGPQLNNIVSDLALNLGDLSASAGEALGGDRFDAFFDYLDREAGPLLLEFGQSVGYVTEGLANLLVAFGPLSSDFSGGLREMTRSFAEWSSRLDDNSSFQEFLAYLRTNGPAAIDFLGSLVQALASVVEAAAPVGQAVLPILTGILDVFAAIAGTSIGSSILGAAAAFVAFNRVASIASPMVSRLGDALFLTDRAFQQAGTSATVAGGKIKGALKFGGVIASLMLLSDAMDALQPKLDGATLGRDLESLALGTGVSDQLQGVGEDIRRAAMGINTIGEPLEELTTGAIRFASLGFLDFNTTLDGTQQNLATVDEQLAQLVESGNADSAAAAFAYFRNDALSMGVSMEDITARFPEYEKALRNAGVEAEDAGDAHAEMAAEFDSASIATEKLRDRLKNAREELKENRQSARDVAETFVNLGDSLDDSEKSLGDWLKELERNAAALRRFQRNAETAAENGLNRGLIESLREAGSAGALRMEQLANASESEIERANKAWRDGQGAVKDFVNEVGGVKPKYVTRLEAQVEQAMSEIRRLKAALDIPDEFVNVWVTRRTVNQSPGFGPRGSADGGTVPKTGRHYADRHPYLLADGEEVISNRYGQADRFRPVLKAINAARAADGATVGRVMAQYERAAMSAPRSPSVTVAAPDLSGISGEVAQLKAALAQQTADLTAALADNGDRVGRQIAYPFGAAARRA